MDFDIDMEDANYFAREITQIPSSYTEDIVTGEEQEPGEIDDAPADATDSEQNIIVPTKVHVRGVDTLSTDDVNSYLTAYYKGGQVDRIEWIDDSSLNLLFKSEASAREALLSLTTLEIVDPAQLAPRELLPARPHAQRPECALQVRFAVAGDKKAHGAAARSRFYLLNPEYDPEERRKREGYARRYRNRNHDSDYRGSRSRGESRRSARHEEDDPEPFDVNLYDDDPASLAKRTRRPSRARAGSSSSRSSESDRIRTPAADRNREKELFPDRPVRRFLHTRDRSASPARNNDRYRDVAVDADRESRADAELRSREKARSTKERLSRDNPVKPLFPAKFRGSKELFPEKVSSTSGSRAQMDRLDDHTAITSAARLEDRISPRIAGTAADTSTFNIRGLAQRRGPDQGFTIKGTGPHIKELFPHRFGNTGKELFAEGRVRRRQRAEDTFA